MLGGGQREEMSRLALFVPRVAAPREADRKQEVGGGAAGVWVSEATALSSPRGVHTRQNVPPLLCSRH